jgi:NitT/TauT family transport system substrate-binding protein
MPASRRRVARLVPLALAALLVACAGPSGASAPAAPPGGASGPAGAAPAAPPQRVRAAYVAIASNMLPAWLARDQGLYDKHGLDVELSYVAGAAKIAEAIIAGDLDFGIAPAESAMAPGLEGADVVMIASWTTKLAFSALVQDHIRGVADLRGKRLGVTRRGSNSEIWGTAVLSGFGLEPERDFTYLAIGGQAEQFAALQNGALDGALLTPPTNLLAVRLGYRELLSYRDYSLDFANVGLVTTRRYLREQPDAVDRMLRASAEGVAVMYQQPEAALVSLGRYTQTDERDLLEESLAFEYSRTTRDLLPTPTGLRAALDEVARNNPKAVTADPEAFVALEPARRMNDSGFVASRYH